MKGLSGLGARRTSRLVAVACAFSFALLALGEDLLICPECGREGEAGQAVCTACGAAFPHQAAPKPEASGTAGKRGQTATASVTTTPARAAAADVAEARRVRGGDPALAVVLYRNAQALLAAAIGPDFNARAAKTIADELAQAREDFNDSVPASGRKAALLRAQRQAEDFFRGAGRTPLGRIWVPLDWPGALEPPALAAVRHALQPVCAQCGGSGGTACRSCGGSGRVACRASGCRNGWVSRKQTNTLTPNTGLTIREKCPECHGTARVACKECAGRGALLCKKCGGTGEAPACTGCQGTGLEPCRECARKGPNPDCVQCKGTGQTLCKKCGGDGRTPK